MFTKTLKYPYEIEGIELGHYRPYHCATSLINKYLTNRAELDKKYDECKRRGSYGDFQNELSLIHTNITLNAACYIEASLNYMLAFRLGDKFFEETIERNTPQQKLLLAHLLYTSEIPAEKGNDYRLFNLIFKMRNELAHPKSNEVDDKHRMTAIHELLPALDKDVAEIKSAVEAFRKYSHSICPFSHIW